MAVVKRVVGVEESFFKEKGVWILIGGFFLLCVIVAVLSFLRYKSLRRKAQISYRPNQKGIYLYIANLVRRFLSIFLLFGRAIIPVSHFCLY